jgi:hypothetical protein
MTRQFFAFNPEITVLREEKRSYHAKPQRTPRKNLNRYNVAY